VGKPGKEGILLQREWFLELGIDRSGAPQKKMRTNGYPRIRIAYTEDEAAKPEPIIFA
jgi:hypothetical protein